MITRRSSAAAGVCDVAEEGKSLMVGFSDSSSRAESSLQAMLRGAAVIDGTGAPGRQVDVAIADGRIVGVGRRLHYDFPEVDLTGWF